MMGQAGAPLKRPGVGRGIAQTNSKFGVRSSELHQFGVQSAEFQEGFVLNTA